MAEIKLTDAQKARIERNRQRALMLRNARLSSRPYPEIRTHDQESTRKSQVSSSNATTAHAIDTGGGFLLDPDDEEKLDTAQKNLVEDPGKCISPLCTVVRQMRQKSNADYPGDFILLSGDREIMVQNLESPRLSGRVDSTSCDTCRLARLNKVNNVVK